MLTDTEAQTVATWWNGLFGTSYTAAQIKAAAQAQADIEIMKQIAALRSAN